jgi:hypothetical protein
MKSFKTGLPVAIWFLRLVIIPYIFHLYFNVVSTLNFHNISFYTGIGMFVFGVLLFAGGVFSKPGLTIVSGLIIFLISLYKAFISFNGIFDMFFVEQLIPAAIGFFFFSNGNDK